MQTVDHEVGPRNMDGWPVIDLNFTETVDRDKSGTGTEYRNEKERYYGLVDSYPTHIKLSITDFLFPF